jgi:hypothetical protein
MKFEGQTSVPGVPRHRYCGYGYEEMGLAPSRNRETPGKNRWLRRCLSQFLHSLSRLGTRFIRNSPTTAPETTQPAAQMVGDQKDAGDDDATGIA